MTDWNQRVFEPAMDLASTTMSALSIGWGRSVVAYCGLCLLGDIAMVSLDRIVIKDAHRPHHADQPLGGLHAELGDKRAITVNF